MQKKIRQCFVASVVAVVVTFFLLLGASAQEGVKEREVAETIAKIITGARVIISENQFLFNDPNMGDKGFSVPVFEQKASAKIKDMFGINVYDKSLSLEAKAMWEAAKQAVKEAQPIINKKGIGYKGFIPAVFAKIAAAKFMAKAPGAYAKLTTVTPLKNPLNRPDDWESKIGSMFKQSSYEKGKPYSEIATMKGKKYLRLMQPEYYSGACLNCHGTPKGESHIGGGKKEGLKDGEGGAGFSIALPLK